MLPVCLPEKYEILGTLGTGGMGTVWHARDRILDRQVALKVLSDRFADDPKSIHRFTTEARAAASLNHPNIVQIYEFGQTGNGHFLAMELVDGPSLKKELTEHGRFSEARTVDLARQACAALSVAHAAGVVHRDIKPDNMMLTRDGRFKLVDLGLAKQLGDDSSQTMTGQSMGTPHFISPEQILGAADADARADIYSLGATLYFLATGVVPFVGSSGAHVMSRHLNDPLPDPRRLAPELSTEFCRLIGHMMAKEPADRYQSVAEVDADLQRLQKGGSIERAASVATTVQDTVFGSFPDLSNHSVAWDPADLDKVAARLANHIGPLARVLVRKARQRAGNREQLIEELAGHIKSEKARESFRRQCSPGYTSEASISSGSDPRLTVSMGPTPARTDFTLDEETMTRLVAALAEHIGPVARVLVKREMNVALDQADLADRLAAAVPDDEARRQFQESVRQF